MAIPSRFRPPRAFALAAFVLLGGAASSALEAPAGGYALELGLGGEVVPGRFAPLRFAAGPGLGAELLVLEHVDRANRTWLRREIKLEAESRLELPFLADESSSRILLSLRGSGGVLAERELEPLEAGFPGHLVLVLGARPGVTEAIAAALLPAEPIRALALGPAELPTEPLSWDGVAALVVLDRAVSPNPRQLEALGPWLAAGGRLLVENGAGAAELLGALGLPPGGGLLGEGRASLLDLGVPGGSVERSPETWKALLGLDSYEAGRALSPTRLLPRDEVLEPPVPDKGRADRLLLGLGLGYALLIILALGRRRGILLALGLALALSLAAAAGASAIRSARRGDAEVSARLVLPPGGRGGWYWYRAAMPRAEDYFGYVNAILPLRYELEAGEGEGGALGPAYIDPGLWSSGPDAARFVPLPAPEGRISLVAYVEEAEVEALLPEREPLWRLGASAGQAGDPPLALARDAAWLLRTGAGRGLGAGLLERSRAPLSLRGSAKSSLVWVELGARP